MVHKLTRLKLNKLNQKLNQIVYLNNKNANIIFDIMGTLLVLAHYQKYYE